MWFVCSHQHLPTCCLALLCRDQAKMFQHDNFRCNTSQEFKKDYAIPSTENDNIWQNAFIWLWASKPHLLKDRHNTIPGKYLTRIIDNWHYDEQGKILKGVQKHFHNCCIMAWKPIPVLSQGGFPQVMTITKLWVEGHQGLPNSQCLLHPSSIPPPSNSFLSSRLFPLPKREKKSLLPLSI